MQVLGRQPFADVLNVLFELLELAVGQGVHRVDDDGPGPSAAAELLLLQHLVDDRQEEAKGLTGARPSSSDRAHNHPPESKRRGCCLADESCVDDTTSGNCTEAGGTYQGDSALCLELSCAAPVAEACCLADGSCLDLPVALCSGTPQGASSVCPQVTCPLPPTGACCLEDLSCSELASSACALLDAIYGGDGTSCGPQACYIFIDGFESGNVSAWSSSVGAI